MSATGCSGFSGFYGRDVAHVHDTGHGDYARDAAPDLLRRLHEAGLDGGLVVDLGCGSGIWARALLDAGFEVLGVDLSADLLAIARERAPEARFVQASVLDAELPRCAAVTAMSEVVNYAADPRLGRPALAGLMARASTTRCGRAACCCSTRSRPASSRPPGGCGARARTGSCSPS